MTPSTLVRALVARVSADMLEAEDRRERAARLRQAIAANRATFSAKLRTSFYHCALRA